MAMISINNPGEIGVIKERKPHELPMNAWTSATNMRFRAGFAEKSPGNSSLWGGATVAPYWLLNAVDAVSNLWLYAGLAKVYATDGSTHSDITRVSGGDYAATADLNWTGCVFNGIPIINNGVDVPQSWALPISLATPLVALANWPSTVRAKALRAYKNYLVALDITKSSTRYPQLVKWSHPADPGVVPSSWDETDPTLDAGEFPLTSSPGAVVDCLSLRDTNIIYKDDSVHGMQFTGGPFVFRFYSIIGEMGILSRRCAVEFVDGRHAVFGNGDLFTHDGQNPTYLAPKRIKQHLFGEIDSTFYARSFTAHNAPRREVWFCYPESGMAVPSKALVWSYDDNTFGFRDLNAAHIASGLVNPLVASNAWSADSQAWDDDTTTWDGSSFEPTRRRLVEAAPTSLKLLFCDDTQQFDGVNMTSQLERTGLAVPARADKPPDMSGRKLIRSIWPRISGTPGGVVSVYVGSQEKIDGPVTYAAAKGYTIGSTEHLDFRVGGRLFAVKFESMDDIAWQLHGYELDVTRLGRF